MFAEKLRSALVTTRFRCGGWLGRRRALFYALGRLRARPGLVDDRTDVTIEGFPRSGNTFARRAFLLANPAATVASHWHAPAQLLESVRRGLPSIVVVREPAAAVTSLLLRRPELPPALVLQSYVAFHDVVLRLAPRVVIAPFAEVTTDFGRTIGRLNRRFGCAFHAFRHDADNVAAVFAAIDASNRAAFGGRISARHVAHPEPGREALRESGALAGCLPELAAADAVHRRVVSAAG